MPPRDAAERCRREMPPRDAAEMQPRCSRDRARAALCSVLPTTARLSGAPRPASLTPRPPRPPGFGQGQAKLAVLVDRFLDGHYDKPDPMTSL